MRTLAKILTTLFLIVIGSLMSGCFLQPVEKVDIRYNFIDMDAPAMRLAKPVQASLLKKVDGKWVSAGSGIVPAGAYIKGRAPEFKSSEVE